MLELIRRIPVYYYTIAVLIVTAIAGLYFVGLSSQFIIPLLLIPTVTGITDFIAKRIRKGKWSYSPSAGITGLILAIVLPSLVIYQQILVALAAILQKHLIRHDNRQIFNPAAFGIMFAWLAFGTAPAWWAVATPVVLLFLFSDYLIGRLPLALTFYFLYQILMIGSGYITNGVLSLGILSYPLLFFAAVMLVEPKTSAITRKGMVIEGALFAMTAFAIQQFFPIDVFVPLLLLANILVHFRIIK